MIIAREKRNENIAEYILYMWQVEDMIRACEFKLDTIEDTLIKLYQVSDEVRAEIRDWYADLIILMVKERLVSRGHMSFLGSLIGELNEFHLRLLEKPEEEQYHTAFETAAPYLAELRQRSPYPVYGDVETALTGLYGLIMLRLRNREISAETREAFEPIRYFTALLSGKFREYEQGRMEL